MFGMSWVMPGLSENHGKHVAMVVKKAVNSLLIYSIGVLFNTNQTLKATLKI